MANSAKWLKVPIITDGYIDMPRPEQDNLYRVYRPNFAGVAYVDYRTVCSHGAGLCAAGSTDATGTGAERWPTGDDPPPPLDWNPPTHNMWALLLVCAPAASWTAWATTPNTTIYTTAAAAQAAADALGANPGVVAAVTLACTP